VAIKVLEKEKIRAQEMHHQIKKEISIMKVRRRRCALSARRCSPPRAARRAPPPPCALPPPVTGRAQMVKHTNIVKLYEVLASRTKIFIVLELIAGGELFDKIVAESRFDEKTARFYFRQLIKGVKYCHGMGVCHRDLKPENLLLDEKSDLKISDFGLSALYTGSADDEGRATVRFAPPPPRAACLPAATCCRCCCRHPPAHPIRTPARHPAAAAHDVRHAQLRGARGAERQGLRRPRRRHLVLRRDPLRAAGRLPAL